MRQKEKDRVLGPYLERGVWRLIIIENGTRSKLAYESEQDATRNKRNIEEAMQQVPQLTFKDALMRYGEYLLSVKQNKIVSVESALFRLKAIFSDLEAPLDSLTSKQGFTLYHNLFGKYEVATHRRVLREAKTFLNWCVKNKWLDKNPMEEVEGRGQCRRGKKQLRFNEARVWLKVALELAEKKEPGAVAALITLLLGLRANEIVSLVVRDVDDQGKLLWVPGTKTKAAKRTLEVPRMLQPFLLQLAQGREPHDRLFGNHW